MLPSSCAASAPPRRERTAEWIARLGLRGFETAFPYQLSGGMRKRAGSRRRWSRPEILLMTSRSRPRRADAQLMEGELSAVAGLRKTVIFVTTIRGSDRAARGGGVTADRGA